MLHEEMLPASRVVGFPSMAVELNSCIAELSSWSALLKDLTCVMYQSHGRYIYSRHTEDHEH